MDYEKYWKLAERYLEEFIYPDPVIEEKFKQMRPNKDEHFLKGWDEFLYSYDEFYIVSDLMGWTYSELMDWVSENVDRISELYEEVYGEKDVYKEFK